MANVQEFLDAYFGGVKAKEQTRQFDAEQAFNRSKLDQQMQEHQESMAMEGRKLTQQQQYQDATLAIAKTREAREAKNQIRDDLRAFTEKGGYFAPTPQDRPFPFQVGGAQPQAAPDLSFLGAPKPPVGPTAQQGMPLQQQGQALIQGLPLGQGPAVPMQGLQTAEAQQPDPSMATPVPAMEGQEPGTQAYQKSNLAIAHEAIQAKHLDDIDVPDVVQQWFGGTLPQKLPLDSIVKLGEARTRDLEMRAARQDNLANRTEIANQADETRRMIAMLAASNKEKKGLQQDEIDANHQSVMDNPDSFHNLSPAAKQAEVVALRKEGLPAPVKLNPTQMGTEEYARRAITSIDTVNSMLNDPTTLALIKKRSGAVLGRVGDLEQDIGATKGLSENDARKIQEFRSSVRYLTFQEGKALFGSRIPIQLMKELQSTSPKTTESISMLKGSMDAVRRNAENTMISGETTRFGGKMRSDFYQRNNIRGRTAKETEVTNFPADRAASLPESVPQTLHNPKTNTDRTVVRRGSKVYEVTNQ